MAGSERTRAAGMDSQGRWPGRLVVVTAKDDVDDGDLGAHTGLSSSLLLVLEKKIPKIGSRTLGFMKV